MPKIIYRTKNKDQANFGIDSKGNLWEMQSERPDKPYALAVTKDEVVKILDCVKNRPEREALVLKEMSLRQELTSVQVRLSQMPYVSQTSAGFDIKYRVGGAISVGCIVVPPNTIKRVAAMALKAAKIKR